MRAPLQRTTTRTTRPRRPAVGLLAVLLAAGVLAACGSGSGPGPNRPQSAAASAEPEVTISPDGFTPTWIKDLTIVHDASEDASCPWSTRYPDVPGAGPLTRAMREDVTAWQAVARSDHPADAPNQPCFEQPGTAGLQIGFDFLIASGDVVGVRLTTDDSGGTKTLTTKTYWYDGKSGSLAVPLSLFADPSLSAVTERVVKELSGFPGADPSMARASLTPQYRADLVTDLSFDAAGAVHLRLPAGEFAPVDTGAHEVVLPADDVTPWLSDLGRRAQAQARHPEHQLRLTGGTGPGPQAVTRQLAQTDDALRHASGRPPALVRPPYGAVNPATAQLIARPVILWNVDTQDWKVRDAGRVADAVIAAALPGNIVLMHDIHRTSVQAVPKILQALTQRGYHFVTVSQLFAGTPLRPARIYTHNQDVAEPAL